MAENICSRAALIRFFEDYDYPGEGAAVLTEAYDKIIADPAATLATLEILGRYDADIGCDQARMREDFTALAAQSGIHKYTAQFLLYLLMLPRLREYYQAAGIPEDIFRQSALDLKYKLAECHLVKGIWGSFVAYWFTGFFAMRLFGFGLLQFRKTFYDTQKHGIRYEKDGFLLTPQTPLIDVHIPRTGKHLEHSEVLAEYRRAAEFFRERFGVERTVFFCSSWLLFPANREILKPDSNLARFLDDYEILSFSESDGHPDLWRLFDMDYTGNPDALPADSSLRRGYIRWLKEGRKTGSGVGIFLPPSDF